MAMAGGYLELDAALADQAGDEFLGAGLARHRQHHGRNHGHSAKNHHVLLDVHVKDLRVQVHHRGREQQGVDEEEEAVGGRQAVVGIDVQRLPAAGGKHAADARALSGRTLFRCPLPSRHGAAAPAPAAVSTYCPRPRPPTKRRALGRQRGTAMHHRGPGGAPRQARAPARWRGRHGSAPNARAHVSRGTRWPGVRRRAAASPARGRRRAARPVPAATQRSHTHQSPFLFDRSRNSLYPVGMLPEQRASCCHAAKCSWVRPTNPPLGLFRFALTPAAQQETRELGGDRCHDTNKVLATVGQWVVAG